MTPHRIYILPTRSWVGLAAVMAAMWYAAISQGNSAAYLLMFFLGSLVMVSAIHAHFALAGLRLAIGRIDPVFVGEMIRVPLEITNSARRPRLALAVAPDRHVFKESAHVPIKNVAAHGTQNAELTLAAAQRGRLALRRVALTTLYPLGFFRSWRYEPTEAACLVYPLPAGAIPLPAGMAASADEPASGAGTGGDDYDGARPYRAGESQRHVDWRAAARGQPLLIKQFTGAGSRRLWLDYDALASLGPAETRLAQLSRWVVDAERDGFLYGLRLPGFEAEPSSGTQHYHRCLGALAVFEAPRTFAGS